MNPIRFGESNYNSPYGKDKLQAKTETLSSGAQTKVEKDSFNPKYKSKNNTAGIATSIAVAAASAFALFKGKGKIKDVIGNLKQNKGEIFKGVKEKLPKIKLPKFSAVKDSCSTYLKSGMEAAKKPLKAIGNFVTNLIHKKK